jgi:GNAT superfamily N-acetyltransferase
MPDTSLLVRPALAADWPELAELYLRARRATFSWQDPAEFRHRDFTRDSAGEMIHLAEGTGGRILGFLSLWEPDNFIHLLFVSPDHLRKGIGRSLLADLRQRRPGPFRLKCQTANLPATAFYQALGWTEIERGISPEGEFLLLQSPES